MHADRGTTYINTLLRDRPHLEDSLLGALVLSDHNVLDRKVSEGADGHKMQYWREAGDNSGELAGEVKQIMRRVVSQTALAEC